MINWKSSVIGGLINFIITLFLSIVCFPLFFLGPIIGGITTIYFSSISYDAIKEGAMSGIIGGLLIGILIIFGISSISMLIGILSSTIVSMGTFGVFMGIIISIMFIIVSAVLGMIGSLIAEKYMN